MESTLDLVKRSEHLGTACGKNLQNRGRAADSQEKAVVNPGKAAADRYKKAVKIAASPRKAAEKADKAVLTGSVGK